MMPLLWICSLLGLTLIWMSAFLYEPQEREIQKALERWWIVIDDRERTSNARAAAMTRAVSTTFGVWLDELFGARVLSKRTVLACACFTLASMLLMSFGFGVYTWFDQALRPMSAMRVLGFLFGGGLLFFAGTRKRSGAHSDAALGVCIALVLGGTTAFFVRTSGNTVGFYIGTLAGVMCNWLVLLMVRRLAVVGAGGRWMLFFALSFPVSLIGLGLLIAPILLMNTGRMRGRVADLLGFGAISNLFVGVIAATFMLSALVLCAPKISWPFVSRPIYALARFRVFQNRKFLFFAGSALVVMSIPSLGGLRDRVIAMLLR